MPKRSISIGFVEPKEKQEDTIYVQLTQLDKDDVYAEAVSNVDFKYYTLSMDLDRLGQVGRIADSSFGGHSDISGGHARFIQMLKQENDAVISERRFEQDGLILTSKLKEIRTSMPGLKKSLDELGQLAKEA